MNVHLNTGSSTTLKPSIQASDSELVKQLREGQMNALEVIMRRHNQRLYRIARSILKDDYEARDVVQETYVKAYYQLHQFKGPEGFSGWLSRIASNEAMMRIRKSSRISYTIDDPAHIHYDLEFDKQPIDDLANQQLRNLLENAIDKLPVEYRSVYVMRAIQQLNTLETANSLNISTDLVKTRYFRAKHSLHKILEARIKNTGLEVFEFAGHRCDSIVQAVLEKLSN